MERVLKGKCRGRNGECGLIEDSRLEGSNLWSNILKNAFGN